MLVIALVSALAGLPCGSVCSPETLVCRAEVVQCQTTCCRVPDKKPIKRTRVAVVKRPEPTKQTQVVISIQASEPRVSPIKPKPFPLGLALRGAGGFTCNPTIFGVVGLRGRLLPAHLGLEINTQFAYGHSAQLMVYPVQGPIAWHLDFGALVFARSGPQMNLLAGTGVEIQLVPHLSLTGDWRVTFPKNPDLGKILVGSQLMFGLLLHTW